MSSNGEGELTRLDALEIKVPEYDVNFYSGGGFRINISSEEYTLESSFSYPNAGYNKLVGKDGVDQTGEAELKVEVKPLNSSVTEINCQGKHYQLYRLVIKDKHKIMIRDTFKNIKNEDMGIIVSNQIKVKGKVNMLYIIGSKYSQPELTEVTFEPEGSGHGCGWT